MDIGIASTAQDIEACFAAMHELRPHLSQQEFIAQVQRQMSNHGYVLVYLRENDRVVAAAGYRVAEFLAWGRTFYVDDLITVGAERNQGYGGAQLDWLIDEARRLSCKAFHLDSGVHRFDAHRLYMSRKMKIASHHFSLSL